MTPVRVQKKTASRLLASDPQVIQLLRWCHQRSSEFAKGPISPAEFTISGKDTTEIIYRGVTALKRIIKGTRILFMPESVLITSSKFPQELCISPEPEEAEEFGLNLHEKFVLFLLSEIKKTRKSKSEFAPYFETLPQDFSSHHPGYLEKEAIQCLPTWMTSLILNQQKLISTGFEKSVKVLDKRKRLSDGNANSLLKTYNFEEYRWAWYVVNTRTVFYMKKEIDGTSSKEMALAPFLDLFNHAPQPNTDVTFEQGKGYSIVATEDIEPKEQIFISYGPHPNYKLWSEYGFIPFQSNPFNYIPFDYEAYQQQGKERLLQKVNAGQNQRFTWLRNVLNDKRKRSHIQDLGLMKELYLFENELSANLKMLITLSLWDPTKDNQSFVFTLNESLGFKAVTRDIAEYERLCFQKATSFLMKCDSSVAKMTLQFCETCQEICDNLLNSCKLLS